MSPQPILFDYGKGTYNPRSPLTTPGFSPYSQKVRAFADAANIPLKNCDQPVVLPRPDLEALGVTYRRIPVLAVGKDIFCDSSLIIDVLKTFGGGLPESPSDRAYEEFSNATFATALRLLPEDVIKDESFVKDRKTVFPMITRPDLLSLRPSALAEFRTNLAIVENDFLAGKDFIGGDKPSLADVLVLWVIRWILTDIKIGAETGFGKADWPKVYAWIGRFSLRERDLISAGEAKDLITSGAYFIKDSSSDKSDPLGLSVGDSVAVETVDALSGSHPQLGKLVAWDVRSVTIELPNKLRVHFPRKGTIVRKQNS